METTLLKATLTNAKNWANNKECRELRLIDIKVIASYLELEIPIEFKQFEYSSCPNGVSMFGLNTTAIFEFLNTIQEKLLKIDLRKIR